MNDVLKSELCSYLGELMHKRESSFDWIEREILASKINAINVLLDIDSKIEPWHKDIIGKINK